MFTSFFISRCEMMTFVILLGGFWAWTFVGLLPGVQVGLCLYLHSFQLDPEGKSPFLGVTMSETSLLDVSYVDTKQLSYPRPNQGDGKLSIQSHSGRNTGTIFFSQVLFAAASFGQILGLLKRGVLLKYPQLENQARCPLPGSTVWKSRCLQSQHIPCGRPVGKPKIIMDNAGPQPCQKLDVSQNGNIVLFQRMYFTGQKSDIPFI